MDPLTDAEKRRFDAIKSTAAGPRPDDLVLWRLQLDGKDVAAVMVRLLNPESGEVVGWQAVALLLTDEESARLTSPTGEDPKPVPADDVEGAA